MVSAVVSRRWDQATWLVLAPPLTIAGLRLAGVHISLRVCIVVAALIACYAVVWWVRSGRWLRRLSAEQAAQQAADMAYLAARRSERRRGYGSSESSP